MESRSESRRSTTLVQELVGLERQAKKRRAKAGLSSRRAALAKESGVSEQTLSDWFNGRHVPRDQDQLMKVVTVLTQWAGQRRPSYERWNHLLEAGHASPTAPVYGLATTLHQDAAGRELSSSDRLDTFSGADADMDSAATQTPGGGVGHALAEEGTGPYPEATPDDVPMAAPAPTLTSRISRRRLLIGLTGASVAVGLGFAGWQRFNPPAIPSGQQLWRFPTGGAVGSTPVVVDGVVYAGSDDRSLYAVDAASGTLRWRIATGDRVRASPVVVDGVVYLGSDDHKLYAVDAASGEQRWSFSTGGPVGWSSPVVADGVVYAGSNDHNLYAVDAVSGKERWRFSTGGVVWAPALADGVVYAGSNDRKLYAVDAVSGKERWRFSTGGVVWYPAVADGVVYVGSDDHNLYAFDAASGAKRWVFPVSAPVGSGPAVADGVVYVGTDDRNLYAVDAASGKERWRFPTGGWVRSSPAVADGAVYVGSGDGNLYAVNVAGAERWRLPVSNNIIWSSPAIANRVVYIGSDPYLYAVAA